MYTVSMLTSETIGTNTEAQCTNDLCIPLADVCSGGIAVSLYNVILA